MVKSGSKTKIDYLSLLIAMVQKEFRVTYKKSSLGFLWIVISPILKMVVIGLIFSYLIEVPNYFLFLYSGLILWTFFASSVLSSTSSIIGDRQLLLKSNFPREIIPIAKILFRFVQLVISLLILLLFLFLSNSAPFPQIFLMVPAIIWLLIFTLSLSLVVATLNVRYRDISFLTTNVLFLWFYLTPVLYSESLIPKSLHFVFLLNPLSTVFKLMHISVLGVGSLDISAFYINTIITTIVAIVSIFLFKKMKGNFVDWV